MTYALTIHPVYKGDRVKALEDFTIMKLKATGFEEKEIQDYIEIIKY